MPRTKQAQRWAIEVEDRRHRVEVSPGWPRQMSWYVDGELVARKRTVGDNPQLTPGRGVEDEQRTAQELGVMGARFTMLNRPRRMTWFPPDGIETDPNGSGIKKPKDPRSAAALGVGGIDLDPEPGSPAARYEEQIRENPERYTAIRTLGGIGKVVVPLVLGVLLVRLLLAIPWPDLPLPSIELGWFEAPDWLKWLADASKFVVPVLVAFVLARWELRRRRRQRELKERLRDAEGASESRR